MLTNLDPGLELDTILGLAGTGLLAYGLASKNFLAGVTGAVLSGWFGTLTLARVGALTVISGLDTSTQAPTSNTNQQGQGTP